MPSIFSWYKTSMWGNMIICSLSGKKLFETRHKTVKNTLEEVVERNIDLSYADLRNCKITDASLDGMIAPGASFWGTDFGGSDIGYAILHGADLRCANLSDCCFAHSNLTGANMNGAQFSRTIVEGAVLDRARVSCPSFWECDLQTAQSMIGLVYSHLGEDEIALEKPPVIIKGMGSPFVLHGDTCLWGSVFFNGKDMPPVLYESLSSICATIERMVNSGTSSHNAKYPMPKKESSYKPL